MSSPDEGHTHDGVVEVELPFSVRGVIRVLAYGSIVAGLGYSLYLAWQSTQGSSIEDLLVDVQRNQKIQDRRMAIIARQEIARFVTEASELADPSDSESVSDETPDKVL